MKLIINIVLSLVAIALIGYLIMMIYEPIEFQAERDKREKAVAKKLIDIRTAQQAYKAIKGQYASSFDTLTHVLRTDSFKIVTVFGDADADEQVTREVSYIMALDSMNALGINLDSLNFVPYGSEGAEFKMEAKTIEYQSTNVAVVEVKVPWKDFMGKYSSARYKRYDSSYNPDDPTEKGYFLKFGDLVRPSLNGTWRKFGKEKDES